MMKPMATPDKCKCGKDLDDWGGRTHADDTECIYVPCDDPKCLALRNPPRTELDEVLEALDHWQKHRWLHGCSHSR